MRVPAESSASAPVWMSSFLFLPLTPEKSSITTPHQCVRNIVSNSDVLGKLPLQALSLLKAEMSLMSTWDLWLILRLLPPCDLCHFWQQNSNKAAQRVIKVILKYFIQTAAIQSVGNDSRLIFSTGCYQRFSISSSRSFPSKRISPRHPCLPTSLLFINSYLGRRWDILDDKKLRSPDVMILKVCFFSLPCVWENVLNIRKRADAWATCREGAISTFQRFFTALMSAILRSHALLNVKRKKNILNSTTAVLLSNFRAVKQLSQLERPPEAIPGFW